jgi:hypothetical protein
MFDVYIMYVGKEERKTEWGDKNCESREQGV